MTTRRLRGRLVDLRPLRPSDGAALDRVLRDRRATRFLPPRVRRESGAEFVARVLRERRRGDGQPFAICPVGSTGVIGQIRLMNWSRLDHEAEVGFWIARGQWNHGYGTEAVRLVCGYGFRSMALHRVEAIVVVGNVGSRRTLEKVGFREEGRSRQSARQSGGWADTWRFGLLRDELRTE